MADAPEIAPPSPTDRLATLKGVRERFPAYKDMSDDALAVALAARYPAYKDLVKPAPMGGYDWSKIETYDDPAAMEAMREQSRLGSVMAGVGQPKSLSESALQTVGTAPLYYAAGGPLGRVAVSGGLKVAENVKEGKPALQNVPITVAGSATGEIAGKTTGALLGKVAERAVKSGEQAGEVSRIGKEMGDVLPELAVTDSREVYDMVKKWGKSQVERVSEPMLNEVKKRLGPVIRIDVPALGKDRVPVEAALDAMFDPAQKAIRGQIRRQVLDALGRVDPSGETAKILDEGIRARAVGYTYLGILNKAINPRTGQVDPDKIVQLVNKNSDDYQTWAGHYWPTLEKILLKGGKAGEVAVPEKARPLSIMHRRIEVPESVSRGAARALPATQSRGARSAVTAGASAGAPGTPFNFGDLALAAGVRALPGVAHHIPGVSAIERAVEDAVE